MSVDARVRRVERAVLCIERRLFEPLRAADVADAAGGSVSELHRLFSDVYGLPMMAYARGRRLTEAARMLAAHPDREVGEVAVRTGYGSQAAFTRAFKARFGLTPGDFQRRRPVSTRELDPADVGALLHRDALDAAARLTWLTDDLVLDGLVDEIAGRAAEDYVAVAAALRDRVGDREAVGMVHPTEDGAARYFLGVEGAPDLPHTATLPAGLYAVVEHRGDLAYVNETLAFLSDAWGTDLLTVADRPHAERFRLGTLDEPSPTLAFWLAIDPPPP